MRSPNVARLDSGAAAVENSPPIDSIPNPFALMKKLLLPLALSIALGTSSCLGPDNLYGSIKNWNAGLSEQDWVNELVFLGLVIIPVYPLALTGDVLIFNTITYWSGKDTIKNPGEFPGFMREKN